MEIVSSSICFEYGNLSKKGKQEQELYISSLCTSSFIFVIFRSIVMSVEII